MRFRRSAAAAALVLLVTSSAAVAQKAPGELALERRDGSTSVRAPSGELLRATSADVVDARLVALPGGAGSVALWSERSGSERVAHYAVDARGAGFARERATDYVLHLKRADFDPALGAPETLAPQLAGGGELHLVQFVCPPLEGFLDELRALGAVVEQHVPQHARIVRMPDALVPIVAELPYVRWVGPYRAEYRLEPYLLEHLDGAELRPALRYYVQVFEKGPRAKRVVAARIAALGGTVEAQIPDGYRLEATLSPAQLAAVARMDEVLYVDRWSPPEDDMNIVRAVGGADYLESVAGYTGTGVRGEVMDGNVRSTHVAFQSNPILFHGNHTGDAGHGTSTTGCIFGDGTGAPSARATLPDAQPIFADYGQLSNRYTHTAELLQSPYFAVFQSNSWGSGLTTAYTSTSMEMDDILFDFDLVILQSQSNTGNQLSRPQAWAKNVLSIGAVDHQNTSSLSDDHWTGTGSIGPAADGSIKPDLCFWYDSIWTTDADSDTDYTMSFGGTSAATPCTAGFVGLVQQMWTEGLFGNSPTGATVFERRAKATTARALLVNTATQYAFSGTGHDLTRTHTGWGLPNVARLYDLRGKCFVVDEGAALRTFDHATYALAVPAGEPALRATMVYLDLAGTTSASLHRINDLSLRVTSPSGTPYWGNNGLSSGNWSASNGSSDTLNVIENVFVQNPEAGAWTVEIFADELNGDGHVETPELDADFALVVTGVEGRIACPAPQSYCTAKATSTGSIPAIGSAGDPSVGTNAFEVTLASGMPHQNALLFWGAMPASTPFQGGTLCVHTPVQRGAVRQLDAFGDGTWPLDLAAKTPGDTEYYQVWFRDPAGSFGIGLSDGLEVTYCE